MAGMVVAARFSLTVSQLPLHAHEVNSVEQVWLHPTRWLANLSEQLIGELATLAKTRHRRMQYRPGLLAGFLADAPLDLGPVQPLP